MGSKQNWTLLHQLSTTEYLNYEKTKFSKSNEVGVFGNPVESTIIPSEAWYRYQRDDFVARNNNKLSANLGNLVNRILAFTEKNFKGKIPPFSGDKLSLID